MLDEVVLPVSLRTVTGVTFIRAIALSKMRPIVALESEIVTGGLEGDVADKVGLAGNLVLLDKRDDVDLDALSDRVSIFAAMFDDGLSNTLDIGFVSWTLV